MSEWKNDPNGKAEEHWIDLIYQDGFEEADDHWLHASIKWDGCIHLSKAGNIPFCKENGLSHEKRNEAACDDSIHICDLNKLITQLQKLKEIAIKHFGNKWLEE